MFNQNISFVNISAAFHFLKQFIRTLQNHKTTARKINSWKGKRNEALKRKSSLKRKDNRSEFATLCF